MWRGRNQQGPKGERRGGEERQREGGGKEGRRREGGKEEGRREGGGKGGSDKKR